MKKLQTTIVLGLILLFTGDVFSQVISESAKRKVTIGMDLYTDIWQDVPADMSLRTINQGFNVFAMYNFQIGESNTTTFAVGLGLDNHNMYSDTRIENVTADTIVFAPLEGNVYQRSKINLTYISIPMELKFKFKNDMKFGAGFKLQYLASSKDKYIGDVPNEEVGRQMVKRKKINSLETYAYGFTLRVGYKAVNLFGYYQISDIFEKGKGPELYPISVGITLTPF